MILYTAGIAEARQSTRVPSTKPPDLATPWGIPIQGRNTSWQATHVASSRRAASTTAAPLPALAASPRSSEARRIFSACDQPELGNVDWQSPAPPARQPIRLYGKESRVVRATR